ncbi:MAG TPA: hypothetical protein PLW88_03825, partial [Syntrophorhabdaceae bacterium]|nr:hypothetical protein [Syntrophorhabdaceae bacterium]
KNTIAPEERHETVRRYIMALLEEYTLSAREIARYLKIPEKDVPNHMAHIKKTMNRLERQLIIISARCEQCGFVFKKRDRLTTPGKCPICKGRFITPILFKIIRTHE